MRKKRPVIIPIEVKSREFKSRVYLAARLLELGHKVYIGNSQILRKLKILSFAPGLILENDVTKSSSNYLKRLKNLGHLCLALDEEALCPISDSWYVKQRVDPKSLELLDTFFTRGNDDKKAIEECYKCDPKKLVPAGNPRLDILRSNLSPLLNYNSDSYILIISRFSRSNPFSITRDQVLSNVQRKFALNEKDMNFYKGYFNHTNKLFDHFINMSKSLAEKFLNRQVIIRPHPSENIDTWINYMESNQNVKISSFGTAEEVASGSSLVLHNGCTAGLESAILGLPVFSYMPIISDKYDVPLPNLVSTCYSNQFELFEAIEKKLLSNHNVKKNSENIWKSINKYIGNDKNESSTEIISSYIDELLKENRKVDYLKRYFSFLIEILMRLKFVIKSFLNYLYLKISRKKNPLLKLQKERRNYYKQKYPGTSKAEIRKIISKFTSTSFVIKDHCQEWYELRPFN